MQEPQSTPTGPREAVSHCDLVMKGGITSGVIYPRLVSELAKRYTFKNIGGTSAGAIAAGASAAAELGRQRGHAAAFERLDQLPHDLGEMDPASGRSRLFTLFQPVPALRRHFAVLTGALGRSGRAGAAAVLAGMVAMHGWVALLIVAVGGGLLVPHAHLFAATDDPWAKVALGVGMAVIVALVLAALLGAVAALFARGLLRGLRDNGYGFCSGLTQPTHGATGLTDWLHAYFNELAGQAATAPPLTFGDLWGEEPHTRRINLEVMTSAVSQQMVYSVPFRPGTPAFYYDPTEWAQLFPDVVLQALRAPFRNPAGAPRDERDLAASARGHDDGDAVDDELLVVNAQGRVLLPLPRHGDLPVVVAIRMSLSFPLLLSAIPLYAIDWSRVANQATKRAIDATDDPQARQQLPLRATKIWFSDGGIGSNLPLHLFDALLPRHPTFAVNLKPPHPDHPIEPPPGATPPGGRVYLAEDNRSGTLRFWPEPDLTADWEQRGAERSAKSPLAGLAGFLCSIVGTMQNWRDEIMFPTPGFRDRIVQISQSADEGGLNLNMPAATIGALAEAGGMAAQRLIGRFHPDGEQRGEGWTHHRATRLATFLGVMQPGCVSLAPTLDPPQAWLVLLKDDARYKRSPALQDEAERFLTGIFDLGREAPLKRASAMPRTLDVGSLKPIPQVRMVPRI